MPELPDVEVFRQYVESTALHQRIDSTGIRDKDMLKGVSAPGLRKDLKGEGIESARRHGKYLFLEMEGGKWLVLHFGMTGSLKYFKDPDKEPTHTRLIFDFENGYHLAYACPRKLGRIGLTRDMAKFMREKKLGPDPCDPGLNRERFAAIFGESRATIKSALMNQGLMAGIGNIYSDEILFQAGISPETRADRPSKDDMEALFSSMEHLLEAAIDARPDPSDMPSSFLMRDRDKSGKCPKCGKALVKKKIAGRTAHYCPRCQK
jgi:formamidopyrimidine-DNA glycosylase